MIGPITITSSQFYFSIGMVLVLAASHVLLILATALHTCECCYDDSKQHHHGDRHVEPRHSGDSSHG